MTMPAADGSAAMIAGEARQLGKRDLALAVLATFARLLAGTVVILAMLLLVPEKPEATLAGPILISVGATALYIWFFARQLKSVYKAKYPTLRAMEALILVAAMFLAIFAVVYVMISSTNPSAFTEPLDAFTSYYFALTVLATVGFGDITPSTTLARSVTMAQMAVDITFIAVLIRIMGGAAKKTLEERQTKERAARGPDS